MAIGLVEERIGSGTAAPAVEATGPATPMMGGEPQPQPAAAAPNPGSFLNVLGSFAKRVALSDDGVRYVNTLKNEFNDVSKSAGYVKTEVIELTQPNGTLAFVANDKAIVLIFDEAVLRRDPIPTVAYEESADAALKKVRPNAMIVQVIVITKDDYHKADVMIPFLRNALEIVANGRDAALAVNMLRGSDFYISDSKDEYENNIAVLDPHGVMLRHDLCFSLYASARQQRQMVDYERQQYFGQAIEDRSLVGVVGGYVEFVRDTSAPMTYRYFPVVHITEIKSVIPSEKLLPMFIVLAMRKWMLNHGWADQYNRLSMTSLSGTPVSLGSLVPDDNSPTKRWVLQTPSDVQTCLNECMNPAILAIDVTDGRARIPGIDRYAGDSMRQAAGLAADFNQFLGAPICDPNFSMFSVPAPAGFRGVYRYGSVNIDTAHIDFLNQYAKTPSEATRLEKLTEKKIRPADTWAELKQFEPDCVSLYRTAVVIPDARVFFAISNQLAALNFGQGNYNNSLFDISGYAMAAKGWGDTRNMSYANQFGTMAFNPSAYFYRG